MKNFSFKNILSPLTKAALSLSVLFGMSACDSAIYDFGDNCDPITQPGDTSPEPDAPLKPGYIRIYVRSNPGGGGTSAVFEDNNEENSAATHEGLYSWIDVKENSSFSLSAVESNPKYRFVKWHDDTNDGDLTEGVKDYNSITTDSSNKYTAIFEKLEETPEPEPGYVRIYVRANPEDAGIATVTDDSNEVNSESTTGALYVYVDVEQGGSYSLIASEVGPEYRFVKWHDDTNDSDLAEGTKVNTGLTATTTTRYTAEFEKVDAAPAPLPEDGYYVKFVFDRNMQFTDGFSQRVNSVDLYVFDESGRFVTKYHEDGSPLKQGDYLMELKDLPAGNYEFIAWCGLTNNNGHFTVPTDGLISNNTNVVCSMATSADALHNAFQNQNLAPLFHGRNTNAKYVENSNTKQIQTVYLTKNTNNINITLQHRQGLQFNKNRFTVTMVDQNDVMKHDNSMHPDVQSVQYRPYRTAIGSTRANTRAEGDETIGDFMLVELSTARLMTQNNPIISVVDNESGKTVFSIPLVKWALQLRSSNYKSMDDQEYLDREDNYNLMLWLDSNKDDGWFGAEVNINNWHIIDDSSNIQ